MQGLLQIVCFQFGLCTAGSDLLNLSEGVVKRDVPEEGCDVVREV